MNGQKSCCQALANSKRSTSPFDLVVALGFQDGPTEGWLRCGGCGREFRFQWLSEQGPDTFEGEEIRIYKLSSLPEGSIARFSEAMEPYSRPEGTSWLPVWSFPSEEIRRRMDLMVDQIDSRAGPEEYVIASSGSLTGEILGGFDKVEARG